MLALVLVFRVMTLVMAWRMVTPARSMSFFDKADVIHTLSAGCTHKLPSLGLILLASGMLFSRVTRTPLVRAYGVAAQLAFPTRLNA